jgi:chemotaxis protein methyltransferase CheR
MSVTPLTRDELTAWSRQIHELCGVHLDDSKGYLVETRLAGLLRATGAGGWSELLYKVKNDAGGALRTQVISAITTNETSFFRDMAPFELLRHKLFPELIDRKNKAGMRPLPIRILSAACSTGQEVYSTAIVLKELLGDFRGFDIRIQGIDISDSAVAQASYGHFTRMEIERGLPSDKLARHFEPAGDRWKIRDELRATATFRRGNLLEPCPLATPFDIIFCRNVAIYFTEPDRVRLFRNLSHCLAREGALIIGATESITGLCPEFEPQRYLRAVFYQRRSQ